MKKILIMLLVIFLTGCARNNSYDVITEIRGQSPEPQHYHKEKYNDSYRPINYERQKAMWISYIDLAPILSLENAEDFRKGFNAVCDDISELGCNTIYVHVRAFGDAIYDSVIFPQSEYFCGGYDPLEIICETAHSFGLSVHAWINPLRLQTAEELSRHSGYQTAEWYLNGDSQVSFSDESGYLWLDPACPEVRKLIADGAYEIVDDYDVDGLHYDDYFYPTTDKLFDADCYSETDCTKDLDEWRRENITDMCRLIYKRVKDADVCAEVSISPQGNIENNFSKLYADVEEWCCQEGICDRIIPQIYYGYNDVVKPFISTLQEWQDLCKGGYVSLNIGLGVYKIDSDDEFNGNVGIIGNQINDCKSCQGISLYTYSSLFGSNRNNERMIEERKAISEALAKY